MEIERQLSFIELVKASPENFGLKLEHGDSRRNIYSISDTNKFLQSTEGQIGLDSRKKIEELFAKYPDGLKQFFIVHRPEPGKTLKLGSHFHTSVESGGSGTEIFVFTEVPSGTNIKTEQYELGKSKGKIHYDVKSGEVMENNPQVYHVFEANGPFTMVQVLEGQFNTNDLKKFDSSEWPPEDGRMVSGSLN